MDFGIFGFSPEQVQEFRNYLATQQQQQGSAAGNASNQSNPPNEGGNRQDRQDRGGAAGDANGNNQGEPVLMHNAVHNGVVCDICETEIRGFRYKCMQCVDFDLCSGCERKGHHAGHVMMRIPFPEMAVSAINKYLNNGGRSPPPSPPTGPHRGPFPFVFGPFGGHHDPRHGHGMDGRRGGHCSRRGHHGGQHHGHPHGHGEDSERPGSGTANAAESGCPYGMGKKEFKKWAKWMKRAAAHEHRSAEAYARAAAASGNATETEEGERAGGAPEVPPMDFTAVASQIQEFLNYWGVPVDVVELYDQFGNHGRPSQANTTQNQTNQQNEPTSSGGMNSGSQEQSTGARATESGTQDQQPASPAAANLSENMEQMRINEDQNTASAPRVDSLLMDLDTENSGWTILENAQSREQSPGNSNSVQQPITNEPARTQETDQTRPTETAESNNDSTPFASVGSGSNASSSSGQSQPATAAAAPSAPPTFPTGVPSIPLYPVLNQPQIQQILQGVSSAVNSVVRNIPIVTDPRGPMGTNTTSATTGMTPSTAVSGGANAAATPELDPRSMKTLNQLLAMGFSNEGGYLTRLVIAKNGDLEAVLSSLFPN